MSTRIGVRWTIGDASPETLAQLERSMASVVAAFGRGARLAVCVHDVPASAAREAARGSAAAGAASWLQVDHDLPVFVRRRLDGSMAGGLAWRFAPLRVFTGCCELLLATGCVVTPLASELRRWAAVPGQRRCVLAGGAPSCGEGEALAVRGVPPSFDVEAALEATLASGPALLASASDARRAEIAALAGGDPPLVLRWAASDAEAGAAAGVA